jgi:hypothetical protein
MKSVKWLKNGKQFLLPGSKKWVSKKRKKRSEAWWGA